MPTSHIITEIYFRVILSLFQKIQTSQTFLSSWLVPKRWEPVSVTYINIPKLIPAAILFTLAKMICSRRSFLCQSGEIPTTILILVVRPVVRQVVRLLMKDKNNY